MLALYVHFPYCRALCSYCAFNKYAVSAGDVDDERLRSAYAREIATALGRERPRLTSLYFGGGTPSLASTRWFECVLQVVDDHAVLAEHAELTLEANPSLLDIGKLRDLKRLGFNRLSLGTQSLNDNDLRQLGRDHTAEQARHAIDQAMTVFGSGGLSLDFIWGRPHQSVQQWTEELKNILAIAPDHLSMYQLTLERGTPLFTQHQRQPLAIPNGDLSADLFRVTNELTSQYGFQHYETSSYARNGKIGIHNSTYWNGYDYIGIGPGAHGRFWRKSVNGELERIRTVRIPAPTRWIDSCHSTTQEGIAKTTIMSQKEVAQELIAFALRTQWGLSFDRFQSNSHGLDPWKFLDRLAVDQLADDGYVTLTCNDDNNAYTTLKCTEKGAPVLDSILSRIL